MRAPIYLTILAWCIGTATASDAPANACRSGLTDDDIAALAAWLDGA